ncbi:MarR family winged helix-turn-helix transcriptional regulator [Salinispira pacifica]|uniref:MarR family winged helix-turn-helix transcriptional regulator n=1 Tax=Salinispira pacifica TaxID=1307761 RepID=UPI0003F703CC|nr:MarR family transcriptional regulator [Salinispira pacifica]
MSSQDSPNQRRERALKLFTTLTKATNSLHRDAFRYEPLEGKISETEFAVLEALYFGGAMNQCTVSRKILKSRGNISVVVQQLVNKELVDRVPDPLDRRSTNISLTDKGTEMIQLLFPRVAEGIRRSTDHLSNEELEDLIRLTKKLGLQGDKDEN